MHSTVASAPLRSAMLGGGSHFSCCFAPITLTPSPAAFTHHSSRTKNILLKRTIAGFSSQYSPQNQRTTINNSTIGQTARVSLERETTITSLRRNFSESAGLRTTPSKAETGTRKNSESVLLDWNTFFKLRASRRRYSLVSSVLVSMTSTAIGVQVLSSQDLDTLGAQVMGLDPFIVLGLATAACGAVGWLAGPILGNTIWGLVNRQYRAGIAIKEKEFFNRIKRFRVDPSANSIANPVPDYYGEKISSVQGYRQWLKDQRAYNRKKSRHIL